MIWWADVVDDEDLARTYYAKLGYSVEETEGFISKARELGPAGGGLDLKAEGKHPPHIGEPEQHHGPRFQKATLWTPGAARFLGKMECGLVLSSVSPWEYVLKEQGVRKAGGFACKFCEGFWKAKAGSSRVVQLYGRWIQDRMAYYLRMEPMCAIRGA